MCQVFPMRSRSTYLAPEGFETSISGTWPKKVVHHCCIVSLQRSPVVSFAAHPITCVTSAAQCPFWKRVECCVEVRSAARGELLIPRTRLAIMQRRAFSVVGPTAWNYHSFELRKLLMAQRSKFYTSLQLLFF